jgi:hypothetical protein
MSGALLLPKKIKTNGTKKAAMPRSDTFKSKGEKESDRWRERIKVSAFCEEAKDENVTGSRGPPDL